MEKLSLRNVEFDVHETLKGQLAKEITKYILEGRKLQDK